MTSRPAVVTRCIALAIFLTATYCGAEESKDVSDDRAYKTTRIRGRVVWYAEALSRRLGIKSVPEAAERSLALETRDGRLLPIIEDVRGRSFRIDKRLRMLEDVELLVRVYESTPAIQIIRVFSHEKDATLELDYWCEVCAIAMYELKPCDCCQDPIILRKRPVVLKPLPNAALALQTLAEVLSTKVDFEVRQLSLEFAVKELLVKARESHEQAAGLEFNIQGRDLQMEGLTRNQQIRELSLKNTSIADALMAILVKTNPQRGEQDATNESQRLVWAIDPRAISGKGKLEVLITTRKAAKANGYLLYSGFVKDDKKAFRVESR